MAQNPDDGKIVTGCMPRYITLPLEAENPLSIISSPSKDDMVGLGTHHRNH